MNFWNFKDKLFLISSKIFEKIIFQNIWYRDEVLQKLAGIINNTEIIESQLSLKFDEEEGSKIENKFIIILIKIY